MDVCLSRPGRGHAVGYLDDGTMIVVQDAADRLGQTTGVLVRNVLQTSIGQLVFARPVEEPAAEGSPR